MLHLFFFKIQLSDICMYYVNIKRRQKMKYCLIYFIIILLLINTVCPSLSPLLKRGAGALGRGGGKEKGDFTNIHVITPNIKCHQDNMKKYHRFDVITPNIKLSSVYHAKHKNDITVTTPRLQLQTKTLSRLRGCACCFEHLFGAHVRRYVFLK